METCRKVYKGCAIGAIILMAIVAVTLCASGIKTVEGPKDQLTGNEIMYLMQYNNVTGYSYNQADHENDYGTVVVEREKNAGILEPVFNKKIARVEIDSSGIEDTKIYSIGKMICEDGSVINDVLFINEPLTLQWVAISIMDGDYNNLFTFYNDGVNVYGEHQN